MDIIHQVLRHRFLRPTHLHLLLGGSAANLARRCRLLWEHRYLERPIAQRPLRCLTEELIYGLGPEGVALLKRGHASLRDQALEWTEAPKKQRGWPFMDHQLGVTDFFVCLQVAADRAGLRLRWGGHLNRRAHRIRIGRVVVQPDGYFALHDPGQGMEAHHYLEIDRGNVSLARMRERYGVYHRYWKEGASSRSFEHFRVLTVAPSAAHMQALRRAARMVSGAGEAGRAWWGLWFTHAGNVRLASAGEILSPVFVDANAMSPRSLFERTAKSTADTREQRSLI